MRPRAAEKNMGYGKNKGLWGGRFTGEIDPGFADFNRSFGFDQRLFDADVRASIAHCDGLQGAGVLAPAEANQIKNALNQILEQSRNADYFDQVKAEDVHSFVEARLFEMIGNTGGKLHSGRSRNDQVATDLRLWLREGNRPHRGFSERCSNCAARFC